MTLVLIVLILFALGGLRFAYEIGHVILTVILIIFVLGLFGGLARPLWYSSGPVVYVPTCSYYHPCAPRYAPMYQHYRRYW